MAKAIVNYAENICNPFMLTNGIGEYVEYCRKINRILDSFIISDYISKDIILMVKAEIDTMLVDYAEKADYYNKDAVDALLDDKQDVLTFDTAPVAGSTNPVTSGGVKTAIDAIPANPVDAISSSMNPITSNAIQDMLLTYFKPIYSKVVTNTSINLNDVTTGGFADFLVSPANPNSCSSYGYLLVLRYGSGSGANLCQVLFPYHPGDVFAIRCRFSDTWTDWKNFGAV